MLRWGCWCCTIQRSDPDQKHHSCAFFSAMHFVTWESGSCWLKTGSGIEWKHWLGRAEKTLVCFGCFNLNLSPCLRGPDIVLPDVCVVTVVTRLNLVQRNNFVLSWYQREFVFIRFVRLQNLEAALRCATTSKPPRWLGGSGAVVSKVESAHSLTIAATSCTPFMADLGYLWSFPPSHPKSGDWLSHHWTLKPSCKPCPEVFFFFFKPLLRPESPLIGSFVIECIDPSAVRTKLLPSTGVCHTFYVSQLKPKSSSELLLNQLLHLTWIFCLVSACQMNSFHLIWYSNNIQVKFIQWVCLFCFVFLFSFWIEKC